MACDPRTDVAHCPTCQAPTYLERSEEDRKATAERIKDLVDPVSELSVERKLMKEGRL